MRCPIPTSRSRSQRRVVAHIRAGDHSGTWVFRTTAVYARNFNFAGRRKSIDLISSTTFPSPTRILVTDGRVGTSDDPGTHQTYWEYPLGAERAPVRRYNAGRLAGQPDLQDLRSRRHQANVRRVAGERLAVVHQDRCAIRRSAGAESQLGDQHGRNFWENHDEGVRRVHSAVGDRGVGELRAPAGSSAVAPASSIPAARPSDRSSSTSIRSEPFDCRDTNLVDFRFAKRIRIGGSHTLEGRFDFFNVFNTNFVTARNLRSGSTYLVPSAIILPRILQMGVTYNF